MVILCSEKFYPTQSLVKRQFLVVYSLLCGMCREAKQPEHTTQNQTNYIQANVKAIESLF